MKRFSITDARKVKHIVLVDECDANLLRNYVFHVSAARGAVSVARAGVSGAPEPLSHCILNPPAGWFVIHVNGNGLDNRRANLLPCTEDQWRMYFNACGQDGREAKRTGEPCTWRRLDALRTIQHENQQAA